ncbi:polyketide synthase dehydratase domain-containing protein, partial [Actinocorallia lasiicapitis]
MVWPPEDAFPVDIADAYDRLKDRGYLYGPMFRGLKAVWRRDDELFAEVSLPDRAEAPRFGVHPALLDAAMHAGLLTDDTTTELPFEWTGVALHTPGAAALRVHITPGTTPSTTTIEISDETGHPVLSITSLLSRPVSPEQLAPTPTPHTSLFHLTWTPATPSSSALPGTSSVEGIGGVVVCGDVVDELPGAAFAVAEGVLAAVQGHLRKEREGRLAVVVRPGEVAHATARGLVRAAEAENPGRFLLVETDGDPAVDVPVASAVGEPEVAVRAGVAYVPRLARAAAVEGVEAGG